MVPVLVPAKLLGCFWATLLCLLYKGRCGYAWRELRCSQPSVMLLFMFLLHTSTHSIKLASYCSQTPLSFSNS
ncbi:hypothetical protein BDE02_15G062100 [Populus trichocarpa]|nr:hypothetical protein BDE02_15G062100 [Populus trichocarpa]